MPDFVKGCLFVGAAVAVGILAGLIVPPLVTDEPARSPTIASRKPVTPRLVMPQVVGQSLEEAERQLDRRGIAHDTVGADIFGYVPPIFEVCETDPGSGEEVHGTASLRVDLPGLCT